MTSVLLLQPLPALSSSPTLNFLQNPLLVPSLLSLTPKNSLHPKPLKAPSFALTRESSPDSPQPLDTHSLLQQLSDSFKLPSDYFKKLPRDLRLDLNDAAFDLSNGPVIDEIAQAMIKTGKALSASSVQTVTDEELTEGTRVFKFGELQVELTPQKANVGAVIALVFGSLSWGLAQGIQNIPEISLQYASDNALLLAKSLRGTLLAIGYSSTVLSAFTTVGLLLLARQLKSKED